MKPLFRWVVGPGPPIAFRVLKESIRNLKELYGDSWDYLVCFNNLTPEQWRVLKNCGAETYHQTTKDAGKLASVTLSHKNAFWKLYPPRLRKDAHEIVLDNDIVIYKQLEEIDEFLRRSDLFIVTEGAAHCFGQYNDLLPPHARINTGLYGLPPGFDFESALCKLLRDNNSDHFDKQGLVAAVIVRQNWQLVPISKISVCGEIFEQGTHGCHFVRVNRRLVASWWRYQLQLETNHRKEHIEHS